MRISAETSFPEVGIGKKLMTRDDEVIMQLSLFLLFRSSPNTVHLLDQKSKSKSLLLRPLAYLYIK